MMTALSEKTERARESLNRPQNFAVKRFIKPKKCAIHWLEKSFHLGEKVAVSCHQVFQQKG